MLAYKNKILPNVGRERRENQNKLNYGQENQKYLNWVEQRGTICWAEKIQSLVDKVEASFENLEPGKES